MAYYEEQLAKLSRRMSQVEDQLGVEVEAKLQPHPEMFAHLAGEPGANLTTRMAIEPEREPNTFTPDTGATAIDLQNRQKEMSERNATKVAPVDPNVTEQDGEPGEQQQVKEEKSKEKKSKEEKSE